MILKCIPNVPKRKEGGQPSGLVQLYPQAETGEVLRGWKRGTHGGASLCTQGVAVFYYWCEVYDMLVRLEVFSFGN